MALFKASHLLLFIMLPVNDLIISFLIRFLNDSELFSFQ